MEKDGWLTLTQDEPFGDVKIMPSQIAEEASVVRVTDRQGRNYFFEWHLLSDRQRDKMIADIRANRIIWRYAKAK
jgi:hypothetical protein